MSETGRMVIQSIVISLVVNIVVWGGWIGWQTYVIRQARHAMAEDIINKLCRGYGDEYFEKCAGRKP